MTGEFEYSGGHIWALCEPGADGYDRTVLSVEVEKGKIPFLIDVGRAVQPHELRALFKVMEENL